MGVSTWTGPIKAGDVLSTTGTTPGSVRNVGFVVMAQTASITQAGTIAATATGICIPAKSHIIGIQALNTVAWSGASTNLSVGTSATATELVAATSLGAVGITTLTPGTDATKTALWSNVGNTDVLIYVLSTNTGTGVGDIIVRYIQAENA